MWLTFVRHAEAVSTSRACSAGLAGPPLTAEGRRQAARHPLAADSQQPAAYAVRATRG